MSLNVLIILFQIGTNGIIGLDEAYNSLSILEMNSVNIYKQKIICPFWTDLTNHQSNAGVFYQAYSRYVNDLSVNSILAIP